MNKIIEKLEEEIIQPSEEDLLSVDGGDEDDEELLSDGATKEDLDGDEPSLDDLPI